MTLNVIIERGEDGYFVAQCPSLKSCWSQGHTRQEAIQNIREAIELYNEIDRYTLKGALCDASIDVEEFLKHIR